MQDKSAAGGGFTLRVAASFNNSVERDGLQAALANTLRRFAAPAAPHVKR